MYGIFYEDEDGNYIMHVDNVYETEAEAEEALTWLRNRPEDGGNYEEDFVFLV